MRSILYLTAAPLPKLHSSLVPLHPGVCVSHDIVSSSKLDRFDIKAKTCCPLFARRRMSRENDPVSCRSGPRSMPSHLRGAVCAFLCVCTVKAAGPGARTKTAVTHLGSKLVSWLHLCPGVSGKHRSSCLHVTRAKLLTEY